MLNTKTIQNKKVAPFRHLLAPFIYFSLQVQSFFFISFQNYLTKKNNYSYNYTEEELINHINAFPKIDQEDIHFNLDGVINHNLYRKSIHPTIHQKPTGNLKRQIEKQYTTHKNLLSLLKENALKVKGPGYTFLIIGNNNTLEIFNTKNQESPYLYGYTHILAIDFWEHAYYINYENERAKYLDNLLPLLNANETYNKRQ